MRIPSVVLTLVVLMWAAPLAAQQEGSGLADPVSITDMTSASDLIVLGSCTSLRSAWVGRNLVTLATVAVSESMKGEAGEAITVVLPGGIDLNRKFPIAMTVSGAPQMMSGEEVLLFLVRDTEVANGLVITDFAQGKFSVVESEEGEKLISRDPILAKVAKVKNSPGTKRGTTSLTPLAEFKTRIRAALR